MKFMNMKRFGSYAMAGVLALSLAAPAFAADAPNQTTTITGTLKELTLKVDVPTTGTAYINPYGLPVDLADEVTITGQQIISLPMVIKNKSEVPLKVVPNVKIALETGSDATLSATAIASSETAKKTEVNYEAFEAPTVTDDTDDDAIAAMFANLDSANATQNKNLTATAADLDDSDGILILREGTEDGDTQAGGAALVRLAGSATKKIDTSGSGTDWDAAKDKFTATIIFNFEPADEYAVELTGLAGAGSATSVANDGTLALTLPLPTGMKIDTKSVKWESSDTTKATVAGGTVANGATSLTATVSGVASASGSVSITVRFTDNGGIPYKATLALTVT